MKRARLTPDAIQRARGIALWTIQNFGKGQADAYERLLFDVIDDLAEGRRRERSCASLAPDNKHAAHLKYLRSGQHYLIYAETGDEIVILDFIHGARDLPTLLGALHQGGGEDQGDQ